MVSASRPPIEPLLSRMKTTSVRFFVAGDVMFFLVVDAGVVFAVLAASVVFAVVFFLMFLPHLSAGYPAVFQLLR